MHRGKIVNNGEVLIEVVLKLPVFQRVRPYMVRFFFTTRVANIATRSTDWAACGDLYLSNVANRLTEQDMLIRILNGGHNNAGVRRNLAPGPGA